MSPYRVSSEQTAICAEHMHAPQYDEYVAVPGAIEMSTQILDNVIPVLQPKRRG